MAQSLTQEQMLKMGLNPIQIQTIKMLELPTTELQQRVDQELQENPLLEIGEDQDENQLRNDETDYSTPEDDYSDVHGGRDDDDDDYDNYDTDGYGEASDYADRSDTRDEDNGSFLENDDFDYKMYTEDDDPYESRYQASNYSADDEKEGVPVIETQDFHDYLREQIGQYKLTELQRKVAEYIIGNINDRGYLDRGQLQPRNTDEDYSREDMLREVVEHLVDDLSFHANISITDEEMEELIHMIQRLDPPGVGARDAQECIMIQLDMKQPSPALKLAKQLVNKYLDDVARHHYDRLCKRFNLTENELKAAIDLISSCNPTPSSSFSGSVYETQRTHIIPDFRVETYNDEIVVTLCDQDIPPLRISHEYKEMLSDMQQRAGKKTKQTREGISFIKKKMETAQWFIEAIKQRNETLITTMKAIVLFQREYFLEGDDSYLKPMILDDIARLTGYDQSTISRVSKSKYVQTDFGIYPVKHFFSESLTTDSGEEASTHRYKQALLEIIANEDKRHPLKDDLLVELMKEQGLPIARRTIAKYRDQLGIPTAGQRRRMSGTTDNNKDNTDE